MAIFDIEYEELSKGGRGLMDEQVLVMLKVPKVKMIYSILSRFENPENLYPLLVG